MFPGKETFKLSCQRVHVLDVCNIFPSGQSCSFIAAVTLWETITERYILQRLYAMKKLSLVFVAGVLLENSFREYTDLIGTNVTIL